MKRIIKNLSLVTLDNAGHSQTCGYWYLVHQDHMSFTAFATREGLLRWMEERGIELTEEMPEHGKHSFQYLTGSYVESSFRSYDAFYALQGARTKKLDNGDYTLAIITEEDDQKVINYMNCNCKDRFVYDHATSRKEMD